MENIHFTFSQEIPNRFIYTLPERLGTGTLTVERFSSGLHLVHMDITPDKSITKAGELPAGNYGISFNLAGHSTVHTSEYWQSYSTRPGQSAYHICPEPFAVQEDISASRRVKVVIMFDRKTLLDFASEDEEPFLPFLKGDKNQIVVTGQDKMVTQMRYAMNQITGCPYRGKTRALYVEGKVMEIFANTFEQIRPKGKSGSRGYRLSKTNTERIHYAAELLVRDPVNPPNVNDIAVKTGMSRSKFYQGFKMVFGHSPTVHLRSHRLHVARQLLCEGRHNVAEVAFAVGFNDQGYFTRAFTAEFGISPRQML